jgi:hypothetical protein
MQCPLCSASIPLKTTTCPRCGTDLTVLLTVQTLQRVVQRARHNAASVAAQLDHLQGQLDAFATLTQTNLMRLHPVPPLTAEPASAAAVRSDPSPTPPDPPSEALPLETAPLPPVVTEGAELRFGQAVGRWCDDHGTGHGLFPEIRF